MKILIIPDVHGRKFWREPCEDMSRWDKVIFLGDYVDPYEGEATKKDTVEELKSIIALKEIYKDKVILLWGNHDLFYWCKPYREMLDYWSRHDYNRHDEIQTIFNQANSLFQFAYSEGDILFTHAGVNNSFARFLVDDCGYDCISAKHINDYFSKEENQKELAKVSMYRWGPDSYGSIVWSDIREIYGQTPCLDLEGIFQIFGHTYAKTYIMTKYFAMLDMGRKWFQLLDGVLLDKDDNLLKITKL